jgi:uncharacterized membrane protein YhaH (DUF805 family)
MQLSPIGWALRPLKNYANFSGRASRAEFWWFFLFMFVIWMVAYFVLISSLIGAGASQAAPSAGLIGAFGGVGILLMLFWLAMIIPSIAVQVRRLHDTDRSGWWIGGFYLLYGLYLVLMLGSMRSMMVSQAAGTPPDPQQIMGGTFVVSMILGLVMFVYMIALIVFYCLAGTRGPNRYGEDPYGPDVERVFA